MPQTLQIITVLLGCPLELYGKTQLLITLYSLVIDMEISTWYCLKFPPCWITVIVLEGDSHTAEVGGLTNSTELLIWEHSGSPLLVICHSSRRWFTCFLMREKGGVPYQVLHSQKFYPVGNPESTIMAGVVRDAQECAKDTHVLRLANYFMIGFKTSSLGENTSPVLQIWPRTHRWGVYRPPGVNP